MPPDRDARSLRAMFGICLAIGGVIMAPVPLAGPALSGLGIWLCWTGRNADFATAARICLWVNGLALLVGLVMSGWLITKLM